MVITIAGVVMVVLHVDGDCDGSNGDTVVMQKEHGDGDGSNGDSDDVHGQGGHGGHDGGGDDDSIVAVCTGGGRKGKKSRPQVGVITFLLPGATIKTPRREVHKF